MAHVPLVFRLDRAIIVFAESLTHPIERRYAITNFGIARIVDHLASVSLVFYGAFVAFDLVDRGYTDAAAVALPALLVSAVALFVHAMIVCPRLEASTLNELRRGRSNVWKNSRRHAEIRLVVLLVDLLGALCVSAAAIANGTPELHLITIFIVAIVLVVYLLSCDPLLPT
jgi:hypothetical protein